MEKSGGWKEKPKPKWDAKDIDLVFQLPKEGAISLIMQCFALSERYTQISVEKRPVQMKPGVV